MGGVDRELYPYPFTIVLLVWIILQYLRKSVMCRSCQILSQVLSNANSACQTKKLWENFLGVNSNCVKMGKFGAVVWTLSSISMVPVLKSSCKLLTKLELLFLAIICCSSLIFLFCWTLLKKRCFLLRDDPTY